MEEIGEKHIRETEHLLLRKMKIIFKGLRISLQSILFLDDLLCKTMKKIRVSKEMVPKGKAVVRAGSFLGINKKDEQIHENIHYSFSTLGVFFEFFVGFFELLQENLKELGYTETKIKEEFGEDLEQTRNCNVQITIYKTRISSEFHEIIKTILQKARKNLRETS